MFTGLIEDIGIIKNLRLRGNYTVMMIISRLAEENMQIGESVSCDGACLTVVATESNTFAVEASQETTTRTILNHYRVGSRINLERALRADSRLGGHFVTGHVDDTGVVEYLRPVGESLELAVRFDAKHDPLVIEKGSIAVNGASLTVNAVRSGWLTVNLIPFTVKETMLGSLKPGDKVNLEFDMIGKYILKIQTGSVDSALTKERLFESGW
ncbi:MAG: riboflavin synthase [Candidatus Zixiibacteriota bacterium]